MRPSLELNDPWLSDQFEELLALKVRLLNRLEVGHDGLAWCAEHTRIIDRGIDIIYNFVQHQFEEIPAIAIVATGGYGRNEVAPYSDIDLTVVPLEDDDPNLDAVLRAIFRALHHYFGGKLKYEIGYSYRQITDLPGLDQVTRTGLIDARFIAGSNNAFSTMMETFWRVLPAGEFVLAKITEREFENLRTHNKPLVVEPHLKEGAGGLRSFQCSNWIRAAIGERALRASNGFDQLVTIRNLLHSASQRKQDLLTRARLEALCQKFNCSPSSIMTIVLESLLEGDQIFRETKERLNESRFSLSEYVVALRGEARMLSPADAGDVAAGIAIATRLGLSVSSIGASYQSKINGPSALHALSQGEETIRNIDRTGALDVLLPELTACRTLLPGDNSHVYTVFEHTLQVVKNLDQAYQNPYFLDLKNSVGDVSSLYLAALLHDVGKLPSMTSDKSHSEEGSKIARVVGHRLGLEPSVIDTISWLVEEHLTMSLFIRIRDLGHPETIVEFAKIVGNIDRLRLLALLTWADIAAVSEGAFSAAQDSFLRELVAKTSEALEGNIPTLEAQSETRRRQIRKLKSSGNTDEIDAFLETLPAQYLTGTTPSDVSNHIEFVKLAKEGQPVVDTHQMAELAATEFLVCAQDRKGLLSDILGVFYAYDLSIGGLRAFTTSEKLPIAIDSFTVRFNNRSIPTGTLRHVSGSLQEILEGRLSLSDLLNSKGKDPERNQVITRYLLLHGSPAILEIHAPRGRGMPYRLARLLSDHGLNIQTARIGQWAGSAAASFYVLPFNEETSIEESIESAMAEANSFHYSDST